MKTRICSKCGIEKQESEFYRRGYICRTCRNEYAREYRKNNIEKINEYAREYRKNNIEKIREDALNWYQKNKNNPDQIEKRRKYYEKNKAKLNVGSREYYQKMKNDPEYQKKRKRDRVKAYAKRSAPKRKEREDKRQLEINLKVRTCTKCKKEKSFNDFNASKAHKYGVVSQCKGCTSVRQKKYREENKEKISERSKIRCNTPEYRKKRREYQRANRDKVAMWKKKYLNSEKGIIYKKQNRNHNMEEAKKYRKKNKESIQEYKKIHRKQLTDIYIRHLLCHYGLKKKDLSQGIIRLKREQMQMGREIKKLKKGDYHGAA